MEGRRRSKIRVDYRQLADIKLPRTPKKVRKPELYPIRIAKRDGARVKVHYIGYSSSYDEWKDISELEAIGEAEREQAPTHFQPFSLYKDLRVKIKLAMSCGRKSSPSVRISMSFDILQFNGGLKQCGVPSRRVSGNQYYRIGHYRDLNPLLGTRWHYRGLNSNGDYFYAVLETVE